jgi:protein-S-isoprenylcysteine O-methyltransferase Ste14
MLLGLGILSNSFIYVAVVVPIFLFIYQCIVLAEEDFLKKQFGQSYVDYCTRVNRWVPNLSGIGKTLSTMQFNWVKCFFTEYNTQIFWITGVMLTIVFKYPEIVGNEAAVKNQILLVAFPLLIGYYLLLRWLRKSGRVSMGA